ncbi:MAG: DUF2791 family P-loop domain-containing protein [Chloroflexi bacterium]|nr:DUF2791 family P-loop domain-containing protein [Chloroflexota bacterium]
MREGAAVRHPQYGEGVVIDYEPRRGVNVDFGFVAAWVSVLELECPDAVEHSTEGEPEALRSRLGDSPLPSLPKDVVDARRAVLALKLGQVLEEDVVQLSIGTENIQRQLEQAVSAAVKRKPQSMLIEGAWGTGKTHLMTMLTRIASEKGLATATVILDGEGVTLREPMGLMVSILGSLRYPGEMVPCGIGSRLADLGRRPMPPELWRYAGHRMANVIEQIPQGAFDEPEVMEVLEDYFMLTLPPSHAREKLRQHHYRISLPPLKAQRLAERSQRFCDLLKGWAGICSLTGAKGLAVVFDELDVEYSGYAIGLRDTLLEAFSALSGEKCPLLLAFGAAPTSDEVDNANDAVEDLAASINGIQRIKAPLPDVEQMKELGARLQVLYRGAYPERSSVTEPDEIRRKIEHFAVNHEAEQLSPTPRGFVRGTLELLDVMSKHDNNDA